jgi:hypothetical protein
MVAHHDEPLLIMMSHPPLDEALTSGLGGLVISDEQLPVSAWHRTFPGVRYHVKLFS